MHVSRNPALSVIQFIRRLNGGSQPILARASDGELYVVKFCNNLQGANLQFNESIGTELYRAFGLPCPEWKPLFISDRFLSLNRECWIETPQGRLRPTPGFCFGSRFMSKNGSRLLEILPGSSFTRIRNRRSFWLAWLIDICAESADNGQAIFEENEAGSLNPFFIDHGHMFGGPKGEQHSKFLASRYLDVRIYTGVSSKYLLDIQRTAASLDSDQLWLRIGKLPDHWMSISALERLNRCLVRLSTCSFVRSTIETMIDSFQRSNEREHKCGQPERNVKPSVLRSGIQATERQRPRIACRDGRFMCALG